MVWFWVFVLAVSVLLYVLLDGFDLGIGILFGLTRDETRRRGMMAAVAPMCDGNETWLVVAGVVLWGAFPIVYATLFSAFYLPLMLMIAGLILRGVAFEFRYKAAQRRGFVRYSEQYSRAQLERCWVCFHCRRLQSSGRLPRQR